MSIKDYNRRYIITNGLTNEVTKIPQIDDNDDIMASLSINDYLMILKIKEVLKNCETIVISKTYLKDNY